ncbi:hypothetical protein EI94DRAFT_324932 [Lactarius quietus]|nr:hypothetical protein EI94DRAFT_324932 [Lactarius quietus]
MAVGPSAQHFFALLLLLCRKFLNFDKRSILPTSFRQSSLQTMPCMRCQLANEGTSCQLSLHTGSLHRADLPDLPLSLGVIG